ncbi:GGDEF domain-containing protein [Mycoplasmatota bacterium WC44]
MKITKKVFLDLAIFMCGFGFLIGLLFPIFTMIIGIPVEYISNYVFISSCILAGLLVGVVNITLARVIVGRRLNIISERMQFVQKNIRGHEYTSSEDCLEKCIIPVDSEDVIGESAHSFNELVKSFLETFKSESSIREFTEIFTDELDINKLSEKALFHLIQYTNAKAGLVLVDKGGHIDVSCSHLIKDPEKVTEMEIVHKCFTRNQQFAFDFNEEVKIEAGLLDFYPKSILIEPISYKNEVLGLILLASSNKFDETIISELNVYTHGLSLGMHNAIIHEKLQQIAVLDPLTKVYNRRFGIERLGEEYSRSVRTQSPIGIMMLDLDFFKSVNDTYGHIVGDQVLINFSNLVKNNLRKGDVLVRYGGEEFLAILPGTSQEGIKKVAEKIRRTIEENHIKHKDQDIKVTVSIGCTSFPESDVETMEDLVKHADEALYEAKEFGRNRVVYK